VPNKVTQYNYILNGAKVCHVGEAMNIRILINNTGLDVLK